MGGDHYLCGGRTFFREHAFADAARGEAFADDGIVDEFAEDGERGFGDELFCLGDGVADAEAEAVVFCEFYDHSFGLALCGKVIWQKKRLASCARRSRSVRAR